MTLSSLLSSFILFPEKMFLQRRFYIFIYKLFIAYPSHCRTHSIQKWLPRSHRKCKICAHRIHFNRKFDDCWCTPQHWKKMIATCCLHEQERSLVFLLLLFRLLISYCLFFVLLVNFFAIGSLITTTLDKFQFQSQVRLSQIILVIAIRLNVTLYAVFIEWGRTMYSFLWVDKILSTFGTSPARFQETATKGWYRKFFDLIRWKCL